MAGGMHTGYEKINLSAQHIHNHYFKIRLRGYTVLNNRYPDVSQFLKYCFNLARHLPKSLHHIQSFQNIVFYACQYIGCISPVEFFTNDILIQFNVSFRYLIYKGISHFRNNLPGLALKIIFDQPLPDKFL